MEEVKISARSVREHNPNVRLGLVVDEEPEIDIFDDIFMADLNGGFDDKPANMFMPYDKTLYLDADTLVSGDLSPIFDVVSEFDVAVSDDYDNFSRENYENSGVPNTFPEYNTGVIGLQKSQKMRGFLQDWEEEFRNRTELRPGDQPSFRTTLYKSNIRIATLPSEYNCRFRYPGIVVDDVVIFHGRLLNIETDGAHRDYDAETARDELNGFDQTIAFAPKATGGFRIIHGRSALHSLRTRYKHEGVRGLMNGIADKLS
jgi:hypothetical protein